MRMQVQSMALLCRLRIWHYPELWCRSQRCLGSGIAPWLRPMATAPIWPLAWEPSYSLKRQEKKKERHPGAGEGVVNQVILHGPIPLWSLWHLPGLIIASRSGPVLLSSCHAFWLCRWIYSLEERTQDWESWTWSLNPFLPLELCYLGIPPDLCVPQFLHMNYGLIMPVLH